MGVAKAIWGLIIRREAIELRLLRHDDASCYVEEGHGGEPIEAWPVYSFMQDWLAGHEEGALAAYRDWYVGQFRRHGDCDKRQGGLRGGTLWRRVHGTTHEGRTGGAVNGIPETLLGECAAEIVRERFALLSEIGMRGYSAEAEGAVIVVRRQEQLYLVNGHHRCAALLALGYERLPVAMVFPHWAWRAFVAVRRLSMLKRSGGTQRKRGRFRLRRERY